MSDRSGTARLRQAVRSGRRSFLKSALAGIASPLVLPGRLWGGPAPSDKINLGLIGCGSLGVGYHLNTYLRIKSCRWIAVCDPDTRRRSGAAKRAVKHYGGDAEVDTYNDYRKLLERKDIDAVNVVTPDHWHALPTIHACQAGKDVHIEKPLSLTIEEGRAMVAAARRYGRVVHVGSESRSKKLVRHACELVRNGHIGKLCEAHTVLPMNPVASWLPNSSPPKGLDWDLWLGPAPKVPFNKRRCFYNFRWFRDYSGGQMTDWGAHMNDIAHWGLGVDDTGPVHIEGTTHFVKNNMYEFPPKFEATFTYSDGVKIKTCADGSRPRVEFYGDRGMIRTGLNGCTSDPPHIAREGISPSGVHLVKSNDHDRHWLDCIRTRRRTVTDVEIGHRSCTACHLANVSMWLERPVEWDPAAERFVNDPTADRFISRPMRAPWHL